VNRCVQLTPSPSGDGYTDVAGRAMQEAKAEGWGEGS